MPSIEQVAARIINAKAPSLFLDTCVLLDIIRSPSRTNLRNSPAEAARLLASAATLPTGCILVVSSIVRLEWDSNVSKVSDEVSRHLERLEAQSSDFHDACEAIGLDPGFGRSGYGGIGLVDRLRDLSNRLLDIALVVDDDHESQLKAFRRVLDNRPPSRKGAEVKDCAIFEVYLEICRLLHGDTEGAKASRVFCTSNTADYCGPGSRLHPELAMELGAIGVSFAVNLPMALSMLRL